MTAVKKVAGPSLLPIGLIAIIAIAMSGGQGEQPGKHRAPPVIGNVQLTVWVEQDHDRSNVSYTIGGTTTTKVGRAPGRHWDAIAKPNDTFNGTIAPFHLGEVGRLWMQVVQNNNGRIVCTGENTKNRKVGAPCIGIVLI